MADLATAALDATTALVDTTGKVIKTTGAVADTTTAGLKVGTAGLNVSAEALDKSKEGIGNTVGSAANIAGDLAGLARSTTSIIATPLKGLERRFKGPEEMDAPLPIKMKALKRELKTSFERNKRGLMMMYKKKYDLILEKLKISINSINSKCPLNFARGGKRICKKKGTNVDDIKEQRMYPIRLKNVNDLKTHIVNINNKFNELITESENLYQRDFNVFKTDEGVEPNVNLGRYRRYEIDIYANFSKAVNKHFEDINKLFILFSTVLNRNVNFIPKSLIPTNVVINDVEDDTINNDEENPMIKYNVETLINNYIEESMVVAQGGKRKTRRNKNQPFVLTRKRRHRKTKIQTKRDKLNKRRKLSRHNR